MSTYPLPDISLDGRVVIVTGGDTGLGRSMALALADCGASLVIASVNEEGCDRVAAEITEAHGDNRALAVPTDITQLGQCRRLVARTLESFDRLDVLFNNARRLMRGPGLPPGGNSLPLWETDPEIYEQTIMVNVVGTFYMSRAAIEHFRDSRTGKIINISTSRRNFSGPRNSPYGVTKAAVESQTLIWARELDNRDVTVNSLLPGGASDTDPNRPKKEGQVLLPVDIMDPLAVWLASSQSDGTNGCRFVGKLWNPEIAPADAANGAREEPIFAEQVAPQES